MQNPPVHLLCAGISEDWLQQQQQAAASESPPASNQAAICEADGAGADSPPAAAQREADPDDDGILAGLAAADELQDASGAAASEAEAGSGSLPKQPLPASSVPAGATRADVYADAAYWQDDDTAASLSAAQLAQASAQASAPCATKTDFIIDTRKLQSFRSLVVSFGVMGFARCMLWSARCVLPTIPGAVQCKDGRWAWRRRGSRRAGGTNITP